MRAIDADAFYKDICDSLNEMTRIGIAVDGEWLWEKLNDSLENAPTIEPEPHWIPCSERLPEDNTVCLVTADQYYIPSYVNQVDIMIYDSGKWLFYNVDDIDTDKTCLIPIIAWMPLPECYREGRE